MRRPLLPFTCSQLFNNQTGIALPIVLGAVCLLAAIAVGVSLQVRSELKAAQLEQDVAQAQVLIWSGMQHAAREAALHLSQFGATKPSPASDPTTFTPCTPKPVGTAPVIDTTALGSVAAGPNPNFDPTGPAYCVDVLQRYSYKITFDKAYAGTPIQVPAVVRYQLRATESVHSVPAWIVILGTKVSIYYDRQWCAPKQKWDNNDFCEQGG